MARAADTRGTGETEARGIPRAGEAGDLGPDALTAGDSDARGHDALTAGDTDGRGPDALTASDSDGQGSGAVEDSDAAPIIPVSGVAPDPRPQAPGAPPLEVHRGDFVQSLVLSGDLDAVNRQPIVVPETPDWEIQVRWLVEDGTRVEAGDRLVELDTAQIATQLADKQIALETALNELASGRAEVSGELAERELALETARIALEKAQLEAEVPRDVQSQRQYEQRQLALEQARVAFEKAGADLEGYRVSSEAELGVLQVDVETAEREVAEARRAIDTMVLRAPRAGMVVVAENYREDRKFQEGDMAYTGAELAAIPDLSRMMVVALLSDVDDGKVEPGMPATCILDAYPDLPVGCSVQSVSPVAQSAGTRSWQRHFHVVVDLEHTDPEIMLPGMSARVEVVTAGRPDAVLAPRGALVLGDDGPRLLAADGGEIPVTLGPCNARVCVVEDGAAPGTPLRLR